MSSTVTARKAVKKLDARLEDILRWAGVTDGNESTVVDLDVVTKNRDAENNERRQAATGAATSANPRLAKAGRKRLHESSRRVRLDFTLQPADRAVLREIQDWVNDKRSRMAWAPPVGWQPADDERRRGTEPGTIAYKTPVGWVDNIPAMDFRLMTTGTLSWVTPDPDPSYAAIRYQAEKLAALEFQASDCRMCGRPLDAGEGPEFAQIKKLLTGRYVLPYINEPLSGPHVKELRFRRLHLLHSVWEETLADVFIAMSTASTEEIVSQLDDAVPSVLAEAQRRQPNITEKDVYVALDEVLQFWEETEQSASKSQTPSKGALNDTEPNSDQESE